MSENKAPLISVIVPVYNVESFLPRCVDSIRSQSYKNLEIILIDDGSTDSSGKLCDNFQNLDSRIHVIHQENGGLSAARNTGLEFCKGEYLSFVDSDDYIDPEYIATLYSAVDDVDYVACGYTYRDLAGKLLSNLHPSVEICLSGEQTLIGHYSGENSFLGINSVYVWGRLYKRALWNQIRFPQGLFFEDLFLMPHILEKCERVKFLPYCGYNYQCNPSSITNSRSNEHRKKCYLDSLAIFENHLEFYRTHSFEQLVVSVECQKADKIMTHALRDTIPEGLEQDSMKILQKSIGYLLAQKIPTSTKLRYFTFILFGKRGYRLLKKLHG